MHRAICFHPQPPSAEPHHIMAQQLTCIKEHHHPAHWLAPPLQIAAVHGQLVAYHLIRAIIFMQHRQQEDVRVAPLHRLVFLAKQTPVQYLAA